MFQETSSSAPSDKCDLQLLLHDNQRRVHSTPRSSTTPHLLCLRFSSDATSPQNLSVPAQPSPHGSDSRLVSPAIPTRPSPLPRSLASPLPASPSNYRFNPDDPEPHVKDLSFLLEPSFYLPIPQSEVPPQFRIALQPLQTSRSVPELLAETERLLSGGDFLSAAHLAARVLTAPELDSTDIKTISDLLSIRYSCLELTGNTLIAAQESKALEDLNSEFYYINPPMSSSKKSHSDSTSRISSHILPFPLRVQASRLQSIGFSDPRRAVSALYDLGLECRDYVASPDTSATDREVWGRRLTELGIRVANALIEINDIDCAKRTLRSLQASTEPHSIARICLLLMKVGDISAAKEMLGHSGETSAVQVALLATVEGRFEDAVREWEILSSQKQGPSVDSIIRENQAVCYLYSGRVKDARQLLEESVGKGQSHKSLTFNLATVYELCSEKSRDLKMKLTRIV